MALCIASLLLAVSPVFIAGQDFVVGSSSSGACIGSYCCDGSLIGGTGNSNDASDFTCCLGDPNHGIVNGVPDMTCSAGTAIPLTAATASAAAAATGSATRTSAALNSASPTSDDFSDDDGNDDSSDDNADSSSSDGTAASTASGSMSTSTSQGSSTSSSSTPTSSTSESASASSESSSAGATGNAAVGTYQLPASHIAVGIVALGYNFAL
ncbi:hypothetical protein Q7P35_002908 [Cladosporium inversicolor]